MIAGFRLPIVDWQKKTQANSAVARSDRKKLNGDEDGRQ